MNRATLLLTILSFTTSCTPSLYKIKRDRVVPIISHAVYSDESYNLDHRSSNRSKSFTFKGSDGKEIIINEAVKDPQSGEMVRLRHLNEIYVSAKSLNISERGGVVRLDFIIRVPHSLQKSEWQTTLLPILTRGADTIHLEKIILTGYGFKRSQIKGYKRYERFLRTIIPDDADFIEVYTDLPNLAIFLDRHLPVSRLISGIENDSITTRFGVSEKKILEHYLKEWLIERNNRKKEEKERLFLKYVKHPYIKNSRLDSVIKMVNGDFAYHYSQELNTTESSKKISLNICAQVKSIWGSSLTLPCSDTLNYYISSMINFTDTTKRHISKVVERRVIESFDTRINFGVNSTEVDPELDSNRFYLSRLRDYISNVCRENLYNTDSVIITAFSSPEGHFKLNENLSMHRGESVYRYFKGSIDSLKMDSLSGPIVRRVSVAEDWPGLRNLILPEVNLKDKSSILELFTIRDPDIRESKISLHKEDYRYIKERLYPALRRVSFTFHLSRKDMEKDTIHTSEEDTLYMRGVAHLQRREYTRAVDILKEYRDINSAIAYLSMGKDFSASEILSSLKESASVLYLKAIVASIRGDEESAVNLFLRSVELNLSMAYRGALDPEISFLIKKYNLNNEIFR
jgi:hypothetical protein